MKLTKKKLKQLILEEYKKGDWLPALYKKVQNLNSEIDKIQAAMDNIEKKIEDGYVLDNTSPKVYKKAKEIYDQTFKEYDELEASVDAELDRLIDQSISLMKKYGTKAVVKKNTELIRKKIKVFNLYPKYVNAYFDALEKNNFPTDTRIVKRMKEVLGMQLKNQKDKLQQQMSHFQKMSAMDKEVEDAERDL